MISIVVYGRNDNYGYNLHKRAAISLNCLAELLRHADDELIFVDYNTPDDLPTFPEAIADTLTAQARSMLRIIRVRPNIHLRYADKTPLFALEAVARNIGVRRFDKIFARLDLVKVFPGPDRRIRVPDIARPPIPIRLNSGDVRVL